MYINRLCFNDNKVWLNHLYNHQICSKNFGPKSHLVDFIFHVNNENIKLTASGGARDVKANL